MKSLTVQLLMVFCSINGVVEDLEYRLPLPVFLNQENQTKYIFSSRKKLVLYFRTKYSFDTFISLVILHRYILVTLT